MADNCFLIHHSAFIIYQKLSLNANWMTRGPALIEVMRPKVEGTAMLAFGLAKLAQLKRLKNSVRNSPRTFSRSGMNLITEKSMFFCPGPVRMLRPVLPKGAVGSNVGLLTVPTLAPDRIGREMTNAAMLKY